MPLLNVNPVRCRDCDRLLGAVVLDCFVCAPIPDTDVPGQNTLASFICSGLIGPAIVTGSIHCPGCRLLYLIDRTPGLPGLITVMPAARQPFTERRRADMLRSRMGAGNARAREGKAY